MTHVTSILKWPPKPYLKECPIHTLQEFVIKVEISQETKKSKMHFFAFPKNLNRIDPQETHHQGSHNEFA